MASPYQGQADDFDIDIDLMEDHDHASNMDSDMIGAEDFQNTSQPSLFNDANNDADMADEPSEGSMVDADNFVDEDHDIEVQDEDVTYEAEMLEGDQDEEIVEAVPTIHIEDAVTSNDSLHQLNQDVTEPAPEIIASDQQAPEEPQPVSTPSLEETEVSKQEPQSPPPPQPEPQTQLQAKEEPEPEPEHHEQNNLFGTKPSGDNEDGAPNEDKAVDTGATVDQIGLDNKTNAAVEASQSVTAEKQSTHLETNASQNTEAQPATELQPSINPAEDDSAQTAEEHDAEHGDPLTESHDTNDNETLHPVKVLYQDNVISLFPPLEGDSAETFFLHDEDVAYDSIGKLFNSLREVLLDNIAEDEVLIIDIDALGIQLTEDSIHNSKTTLHHILDIYTHLSHNDGVTDPDALYLTLGSKISAHAELASLESAAKTGKGLSQVHAWDVDYEDGGNDEVTEHEVDQSSKDLPSNKPNVEDTGKPDEASHSVQEIAPSAEAETSGSNTFKGQGADASQAELDHAHADKAPSEENRSQEGAEPYHDVHEEKHDNAEAPMTESSTTIGSVPDATAQSEDDYPDANEDNWEHPEHYHQPDDEPNGQDLNHENVDEHHIGEHHDDPHSEEAQDETHDEEVQVLETSTDAEDVNEKPEYDEEPGEESNPEADSQDGLVDQNEDYRSQGESESTVGNVPHEEHADLQAHNQDYGFGPEDDLLGIAEDVLQSTQNDHDDQPDNPEDDLATPPGEEVDAHGSQDGEGGNDDLYVDLEPSETVELGDTDQSPADAQPIDNASAKRSREVEDEWDFADTNPDLKRRRPS